MATKTKYRVIQFGVGASGSEMVKKMSKKKSISAKVNEMKPKIVRVFDGKSADERLTTNEIVTALDIKLNAFRRSILLAAIYELTNEKVLRHDGYSLSKGGNSHDRK